MLHTFLPLVPLALVGAVFFKKKVAAYGLPVFLTLLKMSLTQSSKIYLFTCASLLLGVGIARAIGRKWGTSWPTLIVMGFAGVFVYELVSNFGVWILGACVPGEPPLYAVTASGLVRCYQAALPYASFHLLRDVPLFLLFAKGISLLAKAGQRKALLPHESSY